jgi:predicted RNA binding protein YcfA (HicA-like mRNA interferase family)
MSQAFSPKIACRRTDRGAWFFREGFVLVPGGKGSHRRFRHARSPGAVILSGKDGDDAHHYQENQVRNAIRETHR